jgi:hypothetical protein
MTHIFKKKAEGNAAGGAWAKRLTACLVAVAGLVTASALPLNTGPPPDRDKVKVAEVAAAYDAPNLAADDGAAVDVAAPDEKPSLVARFFKQLRSAVGGAMIGLAVALGQPPEDPIPDRYDGPREVVPGEDVGDGST